MCQPTFEHTCDFDCEYLGYFLGYDVYICEHDMPETPLVIARFGDDVCDYLSGPISIVLSSNIKHDSFITVGARSLSWREYLFTEHCPRGTRAMALGLLCHAGEWYHKVHQLSKKAEHGCTDTVCVACDN